MPDRYEGIFTGKPARTANPAQTTGDHECLLKGGAVNCGGSLFSGLPEKAFIRGSDPLPSESYGETPVTGQTPDYGGYMRYVDGFVLPVPRENMLAFGRIARKAGKIWREHGALQGEFKVLVDI